MALGAGALPIALASGLATAEYIPAMLSRAALSLGGDKALSLLWALTDSRASKAVQDAITGYLPGNPPEMTVFGVGGSAYGRFEPEIHNAVEELYTWMKSNNEK